MDQVLGALDALPEDSDLISNSHMAVPCMPVIHRTHTYKVKKKFIF